MKLHIDWSLCDGRGLCVELLPELLGEDDWGYPLVHDGTGNDVAVPQAAQPYVARAIAQCPRSALRIRF